MVFMSAIGARHGPSRGESACSVCAVRATMPHQPDVADRQTSNVCAPFGQLCIAIAQEGDLIGRVVPESLSGSLVLHAMPPTSAHVPPRHLQLRHIPVRLAISLRLQCFQILAAVTHLILHHHTWR